MKISLNEIKNIDLKGKTIAFSTDTVFGVGALPLDQEGIEKIYEMKGRDKDKPLIVLFSKKEHLKNIAEVDDEIIDKMFRFWPGAITFILPKKSSFKLQPQFSTVGVRIPDSKVAKTVLDYFGPMAVTSVNLSGQSSAVTLKEIVNFPIDYIVDVEEKISEVASTVVDLVNMRILRQGEISEKDIWETFSI